MIVLHEMTEAGFAEFKPIITEEFAQELARNYRLDIEEARQNSAKQIDGMLVQGLATQNQFLYDILNSENGSDQRIGYLWVEADEERRRAFISYIYLHEPFRGQGFGRQTLELLENKMRERNIARIGLHVFASNTVALDLYRKVGYKLTSYNMQKWLVEK